MKNDIVRIIKANWQLKLAALFIAVALWFYVYKG